MCRVELPHVRPYIFLCISSRSHQTHEGSSARKRTENRPSFPRSAFQLARGSFPHASGGFLWARLAFGIQNPSEIRGLKSGSAGITRLPRVFNASGSKSQRKSQVFSNPRNKSGAFCYPALPPSARLARFPRDEIVGVGEEPQNASQP